MNTPVGCFRGLGLCLSGGGFRASFYHIGVLIRLAKLGLLRHVEVISTVSGGSIVGAAYYLKVKKLLEDNPDDSIHDSDYVTLVNELEREFLDAVQQNLRVRTFADPIKNIKMARPNYSRSDAIGELYEKYIYRKYVEPSGKSISMRELAIKPGDKDIHPCDDEQGNIKRINKIPVIILNATSLNSGHNWYFSSRSMGEVPPRNEIFKDIDKKDRYRRIRYEDIKTKKRNFPLGSAVAASAGVPGLFPPMAVSDMYEGRRVQLVDGGVFDNQGVSGALDPLHTCKYLIVSDASGQSDAQDNPDTGLVNVISLTNSIMMGRIREEVVNGLHQTCNNPDTNCEKMAYFHLTRGLFAKNINVIDQEISEESERLQRAGITSSLDDFNVHEDMQRALAHIRTDLDSFTDVEAGCLVANGFLMSNKPLEELKNSMPDQAAHDDIAQKKPEHWNYTDYIDKLASNDAVVLKHLQIASQKFLKPYFHMFGSTIGFGRSAGLVLVSLPLLAVLCGIIYGIDLLMAQYYGYSLWEIMSNMESFKGFISTIAPVLYGLLVFKILSVLADQFIEGSGKWVDRIRILFKLPMTVATGVFTWLVLPILGAVPLYLYLLTIDRYYVKVIGRLK